MIALFPFACAVLGIACVVGLGVCFWVKHRQSCDHEFEVVDDSFDHEYGTEQIFYQRCSKCGKTREHDRSDGGPIAGEDY